MSEPCLICLQANKKIQLKGKVVKLHPECSAQIHKRCAVDSFKHQLNTRSDRIYKCPQCRREIDVVDRFNLNSTFINKNLINHNLHYRMDLTDEKKTLIMLCIVLGIILLVDVLTIGAVQVRNVYPYLKNNGHPQKASVVMVLATFFACVKICVIPNMATYYYKTLNGYWLTRASRITIVVILLLVIELIGSLFYWIIDNTDPTQLVVYSVVGQLAGVITVFCLIGLFIKIIYCELRRLCRRQQTVQLEQAQEIHLDTITIHGLDEIELENEPGDEAEDQQGNELNRMGLNRTEHIIENVV